MAPVWEQRWHPLRREWVIVAAHRQDRPWIGAGTPATAPAARAFDPGCTFCPGNRRIGGATNPAYAGIHVFDNDRPCVGDAAPEPAPPPDGHRAARAAGIARVVCFSPRHDLSLGRLAVAEVDAVLACWQEQRRQLATHPDVAHVLTFENRGEAVGVSNPHPHGQIYATSFVFPTIAREVEACAEHHAATGRALWQDVVRAECDDGRRLLGQDDHAVAFVPWFARYAYEVFVGPRRAVPSIGELTEAERRSVATLLRQVLIRYDNLWRQPFPYVLALHDAPVRGAAPGFGFHLELHPPLRKPGLLKYLAGPEIGGGGFLADTDPDAKAAELRALPVTHWQDDHPAPPTDP